MFSATAAGSNTPWHKVTGRTFEAEFVGSYTLRVQHGQFVSFRDSFALVHQGQPKDAVHELGEQFIVALARRLDVSPEELKLLTAVNSPLDLIHGVDAIVEFHGKTAYLDFKLRKFATTVAFIIRPLDVEQGFKFISARIAHFLRTGEDMLHVVTRDPMKA